MPPEARAAYSEEAQRIHERIRRGFSDTYLTLLSIIQGTALVALFEKVDALIARHAFGIPEIVTAIGLFFVIALLWHQYQVGLMLFAWTPQLIDALLPFSLGVCEFVATLGLVRGITVTLVTMGIFFSVAIFAFAYQYAQAHKSGESFTERLVVGFRLRDELSCAGSALLMFAGAAFYANSQKTLGDAVAASSLLLVTAAVHGVRLTYNWRLAQRRLSELNPE